MGFTRGDRIVVGWLVASAFAAALLATPAGAAAQFPDDGGVFICDPECEYISVDNAGPAIYTAVELTRLCASDVEVPLGDDGSVGICTDAEDGLPPGYSGNVVELSTDDVDVAVPFYAWGHSSSLSLRSGENKIGIYGNW